MQKIRISAVKYYNTLPLVYGLQNSTVAHLSELMLNTPADCAKMLANGLADVALVPVAAIPEITNARVFSDYCIGATGKVRSVVLASCVPLPEIENVLLDPHSKTSVTLIKILAVEYWKRNFSWQNAAEGFEKNAICGTTAGVVIGDKVFDIEKKYPYIYDLAEQWVLFSGLPFVFATWATTLEVRSELENLFNKAFLYGTQNIEKACSLLAPGVMSKTELTEYLKYNINFTFDEPKKRGMGLFLEKMRNLSIHNNH